MKIKFIPFLLLISTLSYGQTNQQLIDQYNNITGKAGKDYIFSQVDTISFKTKDELYFLAKSFFVEFYPFSGEVIQLDDKSQGIVAGKSEFSYKYDNTTINYYYYLKIQVREGRYKIELKDISYSFSDTEDSWQSAEFPITVINDDLINGITTKKNMNPDAKRTIKNNRVPDKKEQQEDQRKTMFRILTGLEENISTLFNAINKHMVLNSIESPDNDW